MELHLIENRIGVGQVRLMQAGHELMRSEPLTMRAAALLAGELARDLRLPVVKKWEGPAK